jgi:hypothetical protein
MGYNGKDARITELLSRTHFYVDPRGYICVHLYTSSQMDADCFARTFDGNVSRHKEIFDVSLYHRSKIEKLCLRVVDSQGLEPEFVAIAKLVLLYCRETDPTKRIVISVVIKAALAPVGSVS